MDGVTRRREMVTLEGGYMKLETGKEICFSWGATTLGAAGTYNDKVVISLATNNGAPRRAIFQLGGEGTSVPYYYSGGSTTTSGLTLIPIPSGATQMIVTLDRGGQMVARAYNTSGTPHTYSNLVSEWTSFTANVPTTMTLPSGYDCVGFTFRVNSSNNNYSAPTDYRHAIIEFS